MLKNHKYSLKGVPKMAFLRDICRRGRKWAPAKCGDSDGKGKRLGGEMEVEDLHGCFGKWV